MKAVSYTTLHDQFIISSDASVRVSGWNSHVCAGYVLIAHPSLPVNPVLDSDGNTAGYVLGWPIDPTGKLIRTKVCPPFHVNGQAIENLEKFVYGFGGRFAFVFLTPDVKRLYLDAGGTLAAVYSPQRKMAGSTVSALVLDEADHSLWSRPLGEFPDNRPNQYWPAGTTIDPGIGRVLPNHYLDLVSWRAIRHYPKSNLEPISEKEVPESVERIVVLLRRHITAVLESTDRLYMPLTAGRDSRMMLACFKAWRDNAEYVTFDYSPWRRDGSDRIDLYVSRRLVKRFGLRHRVLPIAPNPPPGTQLEYLQRIGFSGGAGKSWDFFTSCREHLDLSSAWLTGFAGAVGRAYYSRANDVERHRMSAGELLDRMHLPRSDRLQDAIRLWIEELPDLPLSTFLELAFVEHRLGCWGTPHFYGAAPFTINLTPFSHREIFDTMIRLPSQYRIRKAVATDIIRAAWSDLLVLPFNDYPGIRGFLGPSSWLGRSKQKARATVKRLLVHG